MPVTELLICGELTDAPEGLTFGGGAWRAAKVSSVDWRCPDDLYFLGERQDLLEIAGSDGQILVPMIDSYVDQIDLPTGTMRVDWEVDW